MSAPMFKVFTGVMEPYTASVNGVERKFIKTTASSSVTDRKGHEFDVKALKKMGQVAKGMTIFLNHEYRVPEDLFGTVTDASSKHIGFDGEQNAVWDLDLDVMINDANPRATQAWQAYEQGVRMGVSVGVIIKSWEKSKKDPEIKRITDVDFVEASIVGIPANPRTWVQGAVKSINAYSAAEDEGVLETLDIIEQSESVAEPGEIAAVWDSAYVNALPDSAFACPESRKYPHHDKSGKVDLPHLRAALSRVGDSSNDQCGKGHLQAHAKSLGMGESKAMGDLVEVGEAGAEAVAVLASPPVVDQDDSSTDENNEPKEKKLNKDGETAAPIDPANDDSLAPQEAAKSAEAEDEAESVPEELSSSDPEASADTATPGAVDGEAVTEPEASVVAGIDVLVGAYKAQVQVLQEQLDAMQKQRDEAAEANRIALAIVERISSLPIGRKATYQREIKSFRRDLSGVYGDDFLSFLERDHSK
jgi:hypothetical protein